MFTIKRFVEILTITLLLFITGCNSRTGGVKESEKNINGKSRLVFEKEMYNFGDIKEGDIVGKFIHFKNEGNGTLTIKSVEGSCDCLDFKYSDKQVLPNEEGKIEVIFDSNGFHGRQVKFLKVVSNDSISVTKELMIFATVK
jgi:hypothetical protein